jgi:L-fuculose-phosphate aldolase
LSDSIAEPVRTHDAVLLAYHGAITLGKDIWKAYSKMEVLEQAAYIQIQVNSLGGEVRLPNESIEKMIALKKKMGMDLSSDPELLS